MSSILAFYLSHVAKKLMMQKVCLDLIATTHLPSSFKFVKDVVAEQDLMNGLVQSLFKVKQPMTIAKLATKHALLTIIVNSNC